MSTQGWRARHQPGASAYRGLSPETAIGNFLAARSAFEVFVDRDLVIAIPRLEPKG